MSLSANSVAQVSRNADPTIATPERREAASGVMS